MISEVILELDMKYQKKSENIAGEYFQKIETQFAFIQACVSEDANWICLAFCAYLY